MYPLDGQAGFVLSRIRTLEVVRGDGESCWRALLAVPLVVVSGGPEWHPILLLRALADRWGNPPVGM